MLNRKHTKGLLNKHSTTIKNRVIRNKMGSYEEMVHVIVCEGNKKGKVRLWATDS